MTGHSSILWERQTRVECPECGFEVTVGLLLTHFQIQHGVGWGDRGGSPPTPTLREAQTYRVSFPKHLSRLQCPVAGCLGGALSRTNLRIHFAHRHMQYNIVILEEGNRPYPWFPQCNIFMPKKAVNSWHLVIAFWRRGMERNWSCLAEKEEREGT